MSQNSKPRRRRYIGSIEAAAKFNYTPNYFRYLVRQGKVPQPFRINGKNLWDESVLDEHADSLAKPGVITPTAA
jgi:hypothetical protein